MSREVGLPFASIENEYLRVDYLTATGPRIIGLYARGVEENLLAETLDVHWPTPHGEYYLLGGHRLWTAPEDPFFTCPEDEVLVATEHNRVTLTSKIDASGLEKEISFSLDANCVKLTHRVTWHGSEPIALAPWGITQLRLAGVAILPQSNPVTLQPTRNLVFWHYSHTNDDRFEMHDDLVMLHGRADQEAFKIGMYNPQGWIAYARDSTLFVKRFPVEGTGTYPDMGSNVEAYVKDSCLELETLGPIRMLQPRESMTHLEIWEVLVGSYPATLENARIISRQLSS
jgi:hypothetical protein